MLQRRADITAWIDKRLPRRGEELVEPYLAAIRDRLLYPHVESPDEIRAALMTSLGYGLEPGPAAQADPRRGYRPATSPRCAGWWRAHEDLPTEGPATSGPHRRTP